MDFGESLSQLRQNIAFSDLQCCGAGFVCQSEMNVTTRDGLTLGGSLGVVRKELRAGQ